LATARMGATSPREPYAALNTKLDGIWKRQGGLEVMAGVAVDAGDSDGSDPLRPEAWHRCRCPPRSDGARRPRWRTCRRSSGTRAAHGEEDSAVSRAHMLALT
jgi:hypothetical protein